MAEVTIRELRNQGGNVVDRVAQGERVTITRSGRAVAELVPIRRKPIGLAELMERRRHLPAVDTRSLRADLDELTNDDLQ